MGGRGSGRTSSYRLTLDDLRKIDLAYLRRQGCLHPGSVGSLSWSRNGSPIASVGFRSASEAITFTYHARGSGEDAWEEVTQLIPLARMNQHFGGERIWLVCPGCRQRCSVLYGGRRFYCRRCVKLPYASQHEQAGDRMLRRAQAIRRRLGGSASTLDPFPAKPKGMRWTTYQRLQTKAEDWTKVSLLDTIRRFRIPGFDLS